MIDDAFVVYLEVLRLGYIQYLNYKHNKASLSFSNEKNHEW